MAHFHHSDDGGGHICYYITTSSIILVPFTLLDTLHPIVLSALRQSREQKEEFRQECNVSVVLCPHWGFLPASCSFASVGGTAAVAAGGGGERRCQRRAAAQGFSNVGH